MELQHVGWQAQEPVDEVVDEVCVVFVEGLLQAEKCTCDLNEHFAESLGGHVQRGRQGAGKAVSPPRGGAVPGREPGAEDQGGIHSHDDRCIFFIQRFVNARSLDVAYLRGYVVGLLH